MILADEMRPSWTWRDKARRADGRRLRPVALRGCVAAGQEPLDVRSDERPVRLVLCRRGRRSGERRARQPLNASQPPLGRCAGLRRRPLVAGQVDQLVHHCSLDRALERGVAEGRCRAPGPRDDAVDDLRECQGLRVAVCERNLGCAAARCAWLR